MGEEGIRHTREEYNPLSISPNVSSDFDFGYVSRLKSGTEVILSRDWFDSSESLRTY